MTPEPLESYAAFDDAEPYEFYGRLRSHGEVVWDEHMNAWLVASASAAREVLRDDELFTHPYLSMRAGDGYLKIRSGNTRSLMFLRGEKHRAMHRWWMRDLLAPKWVEQYRPTVISPVINDLVARLIASDRADLVHDYAERIPVGVFARLLGLPRTDDEYLDEIKWLNDEIAAFASVANTLRLEGDEVDPEAQAITDRAVAAGDRLNEMLLPVIRDRSAGVGDDFVARLWAGGPAIFPDWNELDVLDACRRLLFAGIDTTTHAIANGFHMLLTDEELLTRVRAGGREAIVPFVEEVMRLNGSVHFRPRRAEKDVELGGAQVKAGDMLLVLLIAANRDEDRYECPHMVDLEREAARDHLGFSYGPRVCPGAALARAELVEAIEVGLRELPGLALDQSAEPAGFHGALMRSWQPLHVVTNASRTESPALAH